jgi:hypothetical protein
LLAAVATALLLASAGFAVGGLAAANHSRVSSAAASFVLDS